MLKCCENLRRSNYIVYDGDPLSKEAGLRAIQKTAIIILMLAAEAAILTRIGNTLLLVHGWQQTSAQTQILTMQNQ